MASEMLSRVLDAENSDREAQRAAHEQAQKTVDAAVEAGEGAVARRKAEAAEKAEEILARAREQARANEEKAEKAAEKRRREVLAAAEEHRAEAIRAVMETVFR